MTKKPDSLSTQLLSHFIPPHQTFLDLEKVISYFYHHSFQTLSYRKKFRALNQTLCQLLQEAPLHSFLLTGVLDYLTLVNHEKLLNEPLTLSSFEFWLNNFSNLSEEENYVIRAKISGKFIPRSEYQAYFPHWYG